MTVTEDAFPGSDVGSKRAESDNEKSYHQGVPNLTPCSSIGQMSSFVTSCRCNLGHPSYHVQIGSNRPSSKCSGCTVGIQCTYSGALQLHCGQVQCTYSGQAQCHHTLQDHCFQNSVDTVPTASRSGPSPQLPQCRYSAHCRLQWVKRVCTTTHCTPTALRAGELQHTLVSCLNIIFPAYTGLMFEYRILIGIHRPSGYLKLFTTVFHIVLKEKESKPI